jgi:plasmid stabilization system protein ParE
MRVRLTSPAEAELAAAIEWYAGARADLVSRFLDEYEALLERLSDNPQQFPIVRGNVHRAGFRRFPYGLLFRIQATEVEIIACFHGRRGPRQWHGRG